MIPGVVLRPIPRPVQRPKVRKSISTLPAKLLLVIPMKHSIDPIKVTVRQLYFWHKALVQGDTAKAKVVMLAGIQDAKATEDSERKIAEASSLKWHGQLQPDRKVLTWKGFEDESKNDTI